MATSTTFVHQSAVYKTGFRPLLAQLFITLFIFGLAACNRSGQSDAGAKKRMQVSVGEIKEVSLPNRGDAGSELIGTSDNQEVVEVSRRQLAPAVDTLNRANAGPTVFQIKGVTVGTANVTFATRPMTASGNGQTIRTYVVQVTAK
ncbi:hypothetical protein [Spirosoma pulveris]